MRLDKLLRGLSADDQARALTVCNDLCCTHSLLHDPSNCTNTAHYVALTHSVCLLCSSCPRVSLSVLRVNSEIRVAESSGLLMSPYLHQTGCTRPFLIIIRCVCDTDRIHILVHCIAYSSPLALPNYLTMLGNSEKFSNPSEDFLPSFSVGRLL